MSKGQEKVIERELEEKVKLFCSSALKEKWFSNLNTDEKFLDYMLKYIIAGCV